MWCEKIDLVFLDIKAIFFGVKNATVKCVKRVSLDVVDIFH